MQPIHKCRPVILLALVFTIGLITSVADGGEVDDMAAIKRIAGGQVIDRFIDADLAYANRGDDQDAMRALQLYQQLYEQHPEDAQAAWRLAMAHTFVGRRLTEDKDEKKALYARGRDAGQKSIELDPQCAPCYFWTAINMTFYGRRVGMFKMLFTLDTIRDYFHKTIELDSDYGFGAAHRILGIMYYRIPGVLGGNIKLAESYLDRALAIGPQEPMNYLEFVKFLSHKKKGDTTRALRFARLGTALPKPPADMVESVNAWVELKATLASLEAKYKSNPTPSGLHTTHHLDQP